MRFSLLVKPTAAAAALLCMTVSAHAAPPTSEELARMMQRLTQRVDSLEKRNAELERELHDARAPQQSPVAVEKRIEALESNQALVNRGLESDHLSENEPELTARLKAVEMQTGSAQKALHTIEGLEGIRAGLSLTTVIQKPQGIEDNAAQLNYRGDAVVDLPLTSIGDIEQHVFAQVRFGQGAGLNGLPVFAVPNASAFQLGGGARPDDSFAVLAQAWYQASIPLPLGGYQPQSRQTLEVTFGKMDPFTFYDQNAAAGDEARQFLNSVFVHNPLLDAGGDIGVDANGFAPGFNLSYLNRSADPQTWRMSLGVFGAGERGSNYQHSLSSPLTIAQAETEQRFFGGLPGTYRLYTWNRPQAAHFNESINAPERHTGWGFSADQRVGDGVTLFTRFGQQIQGHVQFDRALTLGAEFGGSYWDRGGDSIGIAAGVSKTSADFRAYSTSLGTPVSDSERVAEMYYRWRISKQFELSPNLQYIDNPGGDSNANAIKVIGIRGQINY